MLPIKKVHKTRYTVFHADDYRDFIAGLGKLYPGLRLLADIEHIDWDTSRRTGKKTFFQPPHCHLEYLKAPPLRQHSLCLLWVEEDGWTPEWQMWPEQWDELGKPLYRVGNKPELWLRLELGPIGFYDPHNLHEGRVSAWYDRNDPDQRLFVGRAWRQLDKLATQHLDRVDEVSGALIRSDNSIGLWAGWHALEWCRQDPRRRLDFQFRPLGSPGAPVPTYNWHQ